MSAAERLVMDRPINWAKYDLSIDDLARVISPRTLVEKAQAILHGGQEYEGVPLPFPKAQNEVRLRRGKLHVWGGINHHGKTALLKQVQLGLVKAGEVVCMASLEELPEETFADIAQQALGLWVNEKGRVEEVAEWLHGKLWLYDQQGMMGADRILALMAFCVDVYKCTHFVIDSLMRLGVDSEDNEAQRVFANRLTAHAKALNVGVHLVCHIRKQKDETNIPSMMDIKGSGSITDQADSVFIVWRNKSEDRREEEPHAVLVVEKQRGRPNWIGSVKLWHDFHSRQFLANYGDSPQWYLPGDPF
jgi:twinkle protein